ncbi:hypothetical protein RCL1_005934 [Eukaryota sp. TZLM3-RCL]
MRYLLALSVLLSLVSCSAILNGVAIVSRHGDRAPTTVFSGFHTSWNCSIGHFTSLNINNIINTPPIRRSRIPGGQSLPGDCYLGQLTHVGAMQEYELGKNLRQAYSSLLPSFPDTTTYFRSTDLPRTQESLIAQIAGTFPLLSDSSTFPTVNVLEMSQETLLSHAGDCPKLYSMYQQLYSSFEWTESRKSLNTLKPIIESVFNTKIYSDNDWTMVFDTMFCMVSNNLPLPKPLNLNDFRTLFKVKSWQLSKTYNDSYLRLAFGLFAQELADIVVGTFEGTNPVKYSSFLGHDTTIVPLLALLNINDGNWPGYAASVAVELWTVDGSHVVRTLYNGQPTKMSHCSDVFCPLDQFLHRLSQFQLSRDQWSEACFG